MTNDELQVENGNFTRIVNPLIEQLIKIPFKGCELAVAMLIIRKTYGFQKKQDAISITQFEKELDRGRPTIVKALKNLQLVNIVKLVKKGDAKGQSNIWTINKYVDTWKLVNTVSLVKTKRQPSKAVYTKPSKDVLTHKRKKESITKEISEQSSQDKSVSEFIDFFKKINPTYKIMFGRPPQREACKRLLKVRTLEEWQKVIHFVASRRGDRYCPRISTPIQLEAKYGDLETYAVGLKAKPESKYKAVII